MKCVRLIVCVCLYLYPLSVFLILSQDLDMLVEKFSQSTHARDDLSRSSSAINKSSDSISEGVSLDERVRVALSQNPSNKAGGSGGTALV